MNQLKYADTDGTLINFNGQINKTKIFILAHHDFSIDGMISILDSHEDNFYVSCVEPGNACMAKLVATEPDVLIIQNEFVKEPLESLIDGLVAEYPEIKILVFGKDMTDERLTRLASAGVHGYINERMSGEHIKKAMDTVLTGKKWFERHIMEQFISHKSDAIEDIAKQVKQRITEMKKNLTPRERQILSEVLRGLAIKQIAEEVHLSQQGVKMHLAKLFKKFEVTNRNQLILAVFDATSPIQSLSKLLESELKQSD
ncbi:MAG: response regulator transcription factor [Gammaproteobacteria bacterium]